MADSDEAPSSEIRREIARLARDPRRRVVGRPPRDPNRWYPHTVYNPVTSLQFEDWSAWELIADQIEAECEVRQTTLRCPEGRTGYELLIVVDPAARRVYAKVRLGAGQVIGRSFHYEDPAGSSD